MALPVNGSTHLIPALLLMLSWPSWLTCSGWFTHISGHPSAAGRAQDRESSPVRDRRSTTVLRHQPYINAIKFERGIPKISTYVSEFFCRDFSAAVLVERSERRAQTLLLVVALHALRQQITELSELDLPALCVHRPYTAVKRKRSYRQENAPCLADLSRTPTPIDSDRKTVPINSRRLSYLCL